MSDLRPVNEKEVRHAVERLRPLKEAEEAETIEAIAAGYEIGVKWACEHASYSDLVAFAEGSTANDHWLSAEMVNQGLPDSAWPGVYEGVRTVWDEVAPRLK
jgi:hypothetical protein